MKWFAVINKKTGEAISFGTEVADSLQEGLIKVEVNHQPKIDEVWDPKTRKVVKKIPSATQIKINRLRDLRNKGWENLSEMEKREVKILIFELEGGPAPEA